jgi:hypothetical protein
MNRVVFLLALILCNPGFYAQAQGPVITWDKNTYDFGDIFQGEKVERVFRFTNSGTEPLVITNVEVTCGCTTPKGWPRDPVNPGGRGEITVQFDSSHKIGRQNKVSTVVSNAVSGISQITISVNVLEKRKIN